MFDLVEIQELQTEIENLKTRLVTVETYLGQVINVLIHLSPSIDRMMGAIHEMMANNDKLLEAVKGSRDEYHAYLEAHDRND